jgi:hypothetical protein
MSPYLKKPSQKKKKKKTVGGMAQGVGPEFKSQYCKTRASKWLIIIQLIKLSKESVNLKIGIEIAQMK